MKDGAKRLLNSKAALGLTIIFLLTGNLAAQGLMDSCFAQAETYARAPQKGDYQPYFKCALEAAETADDSIQIYYVIGCRLYDKIPKDAHRILDIVIPRLAKNDLRAGICWQRKGYMYEGEGLYIQAEEAFKNALINYEFNQTKPSRIAACAKALGNIYNRFSDYEKAISYQQKAITYFGEAEDPLEKARTQADLAWVYFYQDKIEMAHQLAEEIFSIPQISDYELGLTKEVLGACFAKKKAYTKSLQITREAIQHFQTIGFSVAVMAGYQSLGDTKPGSIVH